MLIMLYSVRQMSVFCDANTLASMKAGDALLGPEQQVPDALYTVLLPALCASAGAGETEHQATKRTTVPKKIQPDANLAVLVM